VRQTVLTGIEPTGEPHVGNYIGMIRPSLAFGGECERFYFADYRERWTGVVRVGCGWTGLRALAPSARLERAP
jgi:tryptophanyl-tRNA synthetase